MAKNDKFWENYHQLKPIFKKNMDFFLFKKILARFFKIFKIFKSFKKRWAPCECIVRILAVASMTILSKVWKCDIGSNFVSLASFYLLARLKLFFWGPKT